MALPCNFKHYFTGSKSEGLNLKDSDEDYMFDINDGLDMKVVQSSDTSLENIRLQWVLFMYEIYAPWLCTFAL